MTINISANPYHDDYSVDNSFYKILFKPGVAVQARELNQIQSIIQNQIATNGKHLFKDGSLVIPGNSSIDTDASYVKLQGNGLVEGFIGSTITGVTSGITAIVVHAINATATDAPTLYVKYTKSATDTIQKVFSNNEVLNDAYSTIVGTTFATASTGVGSIASIETGFYFIKNSFVQVTSQTIVLDKYTNTPSYKIGLDAVETIITSDDDESLLDNAQGSPNYAAPGADRYKIILTLVKKNPDDTSVESDFIQLITVNNGNVLQRVTASDYSILESTLARRTYDESGDYTVRNFPIDVREYRNNYRGNWLLNSNYLAGDVVLTGGKYYTARKDGVSNSTPPTHTVGSSTTASTGLVWTFSTSPFFNRGINAATVGDSLITQNLNKGKFSIGLEPGKAYVRGYEIEKISTEYIPVNKARTTLQQSNITTTATVGSYIVASNINALPNITTFQTVSLYDRYTTVVGTASGTLVGSAKIRYIEFNGDTTQGTQSTNYKISLFDIKMNTGYTFSKNVKQLFISNGTAASSFSADITPLSIKLTGAVTSATTTITGFGTLFLTDLVVNDWVTIDGNRRRITAIASNTSATIDASLTITAATLFYRNETVLLELENLALLFPLPYPYIKSVRNDAAVNMTSYATTNRFTQTSTASGGASIITLTVSGTDSFASLVDPDNYLVLDDTTGLIVLPTSIVYGGSSQQVIITIATATLKSYTVLASINRSGISNEKTKTLATSTLTITAKNSVTNSSIPLNKADGYRLLQVMMDTGTFTTPTGVYSIDITDRFIFDDGQKSTHYDIAQINLASNQSTPNAPIQITFEYFEHSGTGDYFTVDSYLSTIEYDSIPLYADIPLAYMFDFRPKLADNGLSFTGTTSIPKRGIDIESDFQHYLSRNDKIAINQDGSFFAITGTPDIIAQDPIDSSTGMLLYKLEYLPYNYTTSSLLVSAVDNKRYTMRDIGKLEKRIDNIEYYTSLSMLEQQAQSLEIQDEFGLNRFKNGFIVDNFTGHNIGDIASLDYKCAIDMENGHLRPAFHMDNVNLIEENTINSQRTADGYQITGDLITLPYTETSMVKQLDASRVENINPFAIFTFIGNIDLNPPMDEWFETNRLPDIVTNVEGNFNAIYTISERSGALSPIWNAWQTQWTGTSVTTRNTFNQNNTSRADLDAKFGYKKGGGNSSLRTVVADTIATTVGQSRTGIRTVVVPRIDREVTADRVLSKAVIPYIRARSLLFVIRGLKPNTTFTPFFDSVNVGSFSTQASQLTITKNSVFSSTVRAGGDSSESTRLINGNSQSALDRGDVVFVKQRGVTVYTKSTSPATGVLTLVADLINTTNSVLHVVNTKGTFINGDILEGTITGAVSTITATPVIKTIGQSLVSNSNGDVVGIFDIPNTEANRFRTGVREFKLSDDITDSANRTSFARKQYRAEGIIETKQASVTATRNADLTQVVVNQNQTIVQTTNRVISDTGWYDPLAQTFLVDSHGGAFVTSIDCFFATKDQNLPARMQIREVVNGYPGKVILPFSEIAIAPDKVNISASMVTTSLGEVYPRPIATNFKFDSPVYLNDKTEYAIVLLSDSNNYKVWISQLGDTSVVKNNIISEQPYAGVLFKSQNASTWTADQSQDLMFQINKAKFTTNSYGEVDFVNDALPTYVLQNNPCYILSGTNYIRISHENHGFFIGSKLVISGVASLGNIPLGEINTTHTIISVEYDSYIIQVTTNATSTGNLGGTAVNSTECIQFTTIQPIVQQQTFEDTDITHFIRTTTGKSVTGGEAPYILSGFNSVSINENNRMSAIQMIGTPATEVEFMGSNKSFKLRSRLITSNENISPAIDIARLSLISVQDRINTPTDANTNISALDTRNIVTANALVSIANTNRFSTTDATTKLAFLSTSIGKYIISTGFAAGANNGRFLITDIASDGSYIQVLSTLTNVAVGASISLNIMDRFLDEIAPVGGSSIAKYVSKKINLENPSTFIKIRLAVDIEQSANFDIYYKTQPVGSNIDFNKLAYTKATPIKSAVISNNGIFTDIEYSIKGLSSFNALQVKLVMNSSYSADIVLAKDLVIIACV